MPGLINYKSRISSIEMHVIYHAAIPYKDVN